MPNPFCYVELNTRNTKVAKQFYSQLLDWKLQDMNINGETYTICHVGDGTPGGMQANNDGDPRWIPFIEVDDLPAKVNAAQKLGAKIKQGQTQIPNFGWFAVIIDPSGAEVGLWRSGQTAS